MDDSGKILIVDDDPLNARLLAESIGSGRYDVTIVANGQECLDAMAKGQPDLILLDIMMPDMDGFEVCRRIKENPETAEIPVLYITALSDSSDRLRGFETGAVDYITKPFNSSEVKARIDTHLALKLTKDALTEQNQCLDEKVKARTIELKSANEKLQNEILVSEEANEKLKESESRSHSIINALPDSVVEIHRDGRILYSKWARNHCLPNIEISPGKHVTECFPPGFSGQITKQVDKVLQTAQMCIFEYPYANNGSSKVFECRVVKVSIESALVLTRDITSRKLAEEALRDSEEQLRIENQWLKSSIKERYRLGDIIGKCEPMQSVYNLILEAAASDASVVIYGESGTGKELVARAIHDMGARRNRAFVPVNCGAVSENLLESEFFGHCKGAFTGADADRSGYLDEAHEGTLFLDEVGEISQNMQVKLLRVIDGNGYTPVGTNRVCQTDVRFISASNKSLVDLQKSGQLRNDFFYRIQVILIHLPPLRERKEDLPLLIEHFLDKYRSAGNDIPPISASMTDRLIDYDWPGNVRELQNTLQRYATLKRLDFMETAQSSENRPDPVEPTPDLQISDYWQTIQDFEKTIISRALEQHQWHREKAAFSLGIPRRTFYRKLKKLGLNQA